MTHAALNMYTQWHSQKFVMEGVFPLPFPLSAPHSPPLPLPPLEARLLKSSYGAWGSAPAEIEFGAF